MAPMCLLPSSLAAVLSGTPMAAVTTVLAAGSVWAAAPADRFTAWPLLLGPLCTLRPQDSCRPGCFPTCI